MTNHSMRSFTVWRVGEILMRYKEWLATLAHQMIGLAQPPVLVANDGIKYDLVWRS